MRSSNGNILMTSPDPIPAPRFRPGTIVSFRFPRAEDGRPGKARPCLVVASSEDRLVIAYGTSVDTPANRGLDVVLDDPDDWQVAGLHRPSRFVLARRVSVGPDDPRLVFPRQGKAAIGMIRDHHLPELDRLTRKLGQALFDDRPRGMPPCRIRKHRERNPAPLSATNRSGPWRPPPMRPFTVEHRTARRPIGPGT